MPFAEWMPRLAAWTESESLSETASAMAQQCLPLEEQVHLPACPVCEMRAKSLSPVIKMVRALAPLREQTA